MREEEKREEKGLTRPRENQGSQESKEYQERVWTKWQDYIGKINIVSGQENLGQEEGEKC